MDRRTWISGALAFGAALWSDERVAAEERPAASKSNAELIECLRDLERTAHGRLGVAAFSGSGCIVDFSLDYRAQERFPLCSTSKVMIVGAILRNSMDDGGLLARRIEYGERDMVSYSPVTEKQLAYGMTVEQLCEAAMCYSDNTATNLLLQVLGGPEAVTEFARRIHDKTFRLDRREPDLNTALPGDERDTTTPEAMANDIWAMLFGTFGESNVKLLAPKQSALLRAWMSANATGGKRIRAGVPADWKVADKTGTGDYGTTNDVGVLWRPQGEPIALAVYFTQLKPDATSNEAVIAEATRLVVQGATLRQAT